jgi:chromosome segregation ATPase
LEKVEALKSELKAATSQKETSDLEKEGIGKELACALEKVEALKSELKAATSQKETSDLEKEEIGKELACALEKVEALKSELKAATTQKETSDMEKEEMGRELAQKQRSMEDWQMLSKSGPQEIALQRIWRHRQWICWKLVTGSTNRPTDSWSSAVVSRP